MAVSKPSQISIRLEDDLAAKADALVEKLGGVATRSSILREAMREGLVVLEQKYRALSDSTRRKK